MLGIGGGVFLVPALVLFAGMPMPQAVAAGLVAVIATSSAVASVNLEKGFVNIRLGMALELATVLGAILGAAAGSILPARALIALFGLMLPIVAVLLWRGPGQNGVLSISDEQPASALDGRYHDPAIGALVRYRLRRLWAGASVSLAAGGLSGLLGVGGGVFKVPALHLFCGMPIKAAAATSNFMIGVTGAASAFVYFGRGLVDPDRTSAVVLGVLAGSWAGTRLNHRVRDDSLRRAFAILLVLLSAQMLRRALAG